MSFAHEGELDTPPDPSGYIDDFGVLPKSEIKQATFVVFDRYQYSGGNITVVSNPLLNGVLGAFDQMAIQVVTDRLVTAGTNVVTLSAQITHSGDGRQFVAKSLTPEIAAYTLSASGTTTLPIGYDDGTIPTLAFVRVEFSFSTFTSFTARMKCTLTSNNKSERAFTRRVTRTITGKECTSWLTPATILKVDRQGNPGSNKLWGGEPRLEHITNRLPGPVHRSQFFNAMMAFFECVGPCDVNADGVKGHVRLKPGHAICFRGTRSLLVLLENLLDTDPHNIQYAPNPNTGDFREAHYQVVLDSMDFELAQDVTGNAHRHNPKRPDRSD